MATSAPKRPTKHRLTRRGLFTLGGGVAAAGVVGAGIAAFTGDGADAAQTGTAVGTAEYVAKYNLVAAVPFTTYGRCTGQGNGKYMEQPVISDMAGERSARSGRFCTTTTRADGVSPPRSSPSWLRRCVRRAVAATTARTAAVSTNSASGRCCTASDTVVHRVISRDTGEGEERRGRAAVALHHRGGTGR